jgi:hypothetical protein
LITDDDGSEIRPTMISACRTARIRAGPSRSATAWSRARQVEVVDGRAPPTGEEAPSGRHPLGRLRGAPRYPAVEERDAEQVPRERRAGERRPGAHFTSRARVDPPQLIGHLYLAIP